MDGNLLDPDNADATLAKEWNLPELPAGVEENLILTFMTPQYDSLLILIFFLKRTTLHNENNRLRGNSAPSPLIL